MAADPTNSQTSTLLVDESFAQEDDAFVDQLRSIASPQYLAALADRWKQDPRPWAREQIFTYLSLPFDRSGHHPVVKRLFKQAEANSDDELMARFLVAFDRLTRRSRRMTYRYDRATRQFSKEEQLFSPRDQILAKKPPREGTNPFTGEKTVFQAPVRVPKNGRLFSTVTRAYLRRRAWRYFRWLGFARPAEYPHAIGHALALFADDDFARGENILDNWSLMNIAFRHSDVLKFSPNRISLVDGRSLSELAAAPRFEDLWKRPESASELLALVMHANSRLVRVWAIQVLKRHHASANQSITFDALLKLFNHEDQEVQQFAVSLLNTRTDIDSWPVSAWLQLLETRNVGVLASICDAMNQHVEPASLDLSQCIALACARVTPVAKLGLSWLRQRKFTTEESRAGLVGLSNARCEAIGAEAAEFALAIVGEPQAYRTDTVIAFFDSLNPEVRRGAWNWLTPQSAGYSDVALWVRLLETPYDDIRIQLVEELSKRTHVGQSSPPVRQQDLEPLWSAVLLGVHRGGRAKLHALRQISRAIAEHPDQAERLLPALVVAIRSVRPPEVRIGLSALLSAVAKRPELEPMLAVTLPELRLPTAEGVA